MPYLTWALALLLASAPPSRAVTLAPAEASAHVGEYVTVLGDVASARIEGGLFLLEFAGVDAATFRAVLIVPMISALPAHPEHVYDGRRVQVSGTVRRFRGRSEMVLQSPGQIEIVDLAGAPAEPAPTTSTTTTTTTQPGTARAIALPPVPAATLPPLPPTVTISPTTLAPRIDPCPGAQAEWRATRDTVRRTMRALDDCLSGERPGCRREAAALAPALSELEWSEQRVTDACP